MTTKNDLIGAVAQRCGASKADVKRVFVEMIDEIQRQLLLGEEVRLVGLGRFQLQTSKTVRRVSNLPGMAGKVQLTKARKRIKFRQSTSAAEKLTRKGLLSAIVSTVGGVDSAKVRTRRIPMAKKKGKHITVDVPRDVESVTIQVKDEKPKKKGESSSRKRLYG